MVALVRTALPDLGDEAPESARKLIRAELARDPRATRRVYAALARKVWSLLVERRFDPEIRDWHVLLEAVKAKVKSSDEAASERLAALADLVRESISLSEISPAQDVAERPRARAILEQLATTDRFTKRRLLLEKLGIGSSHLSNILTQLLAHDLIERRGNGKEAEFRITRRGRRAIGLESVIQQRTTRTDLDLDALFGSSSPALPQPQTEWDDLVYRGSQTDMFPKVEIDFTDADSSTVRFRIQRNIGLTNWRPHPNDHHYETGSA